MPSNKARISKRVVDSAKPVPEGDYRIWDTELKGYFLRIYPSGRKVYGVKYRAGRTQRVFTIGTHGSPWTPDDARTAARTAMSEANLGGDPSAEKKKARDALTVGDVIDAYLRDGPATKPAKRASTWEIDASNLNRHVRPLIGKLLASTLTKSDAAKCISDISAGKTRTTERTKRRGKARVTGGAGTARRTRTTAAAMFNWAIEHELVTENPFRAVKLAPPKARERFLSIKEAQALLNAADELLGEDHADAIRLLLLTGARKTEIIALQWSEVELDHDVIVLSGERTKAGNKTGGRRIILSPAAKSVLERRRESDRRSIAPSPYVFPARRGDGPMVFLRKPFKLACQRAGIPDLRIHDLRHSFASFAAADGASLFLIGKLLGHATMRSTERYAHLADEPLRLAAASVGQQLGLAAE